MPTPKTIVGIYGKIEHETTKRMFDGMLRYMEQTGGFVARAFEGPKGVSESRFAPPWRAKCHGIVACMGKQPDMSDTEVGDWVISGGVPSVNVTRDWEDPRIPQVSITQRDLGKIAGTHLIECGCAAFLYVGNALSTANADRCAAFAAALGEQGRSAASYNIAYHPNEQGFEPHDIRVESELLEKLRALPKPIGIWMINDEHAPLVYLHCARLKLQIPAQVKIIGTRDFQIARRMKPMLTSLRTSQELVGYTGMKALHAQIQGKRVVQSSRIVGEPALAERGSTSAKPKVKNYVRYALKYIEINACAGMSVEEIAEAAGVPRRTLDRQFQEVVGHSPLEEINRVRLERAQMLLTKHDLPIGGVAALVGFEENAGFTKFFTKQTGLSPTEYRLRQRK